MIFDAITSDAVRTRFANRFKLFRLCVLYVFACYVVMQITGCHSSNSENQAIGSAVQLIHRAKFQEAVDILTPLAESGDPKAMFLLSVSYTGVSQISDSTKASQWKEKSISGLEKLSAKGDAMGMYYLGSILAAEKETRERGDALLEKAFPIILEEAVSSDDSSVQFRIGQAYYFGRGTPQNFEKAYQWFSKAAEAENPSAQEGLAIMYNSGQHVEKSDLKSLAWLQKAAEQGLPNSQYCLGDAYLNGSGVSKDSTEAAKWFLKASEQGDKVAKEKLNELIAGKSAPTSGSLARATNETISKTNTPRKLPSFPPYGNYPPTLFPTGWEPVSDPALLEKVIEAAKSVRKDSSAMCVACRVRKLSCYGDCCIIEANISPKSVYSWLLADDVWVLLNGTSPPVHHVNDKSPPKLEPDTAAIEYLNLFVSSLTGGDHRFRILYGSESLLPFSSNRGEVNLPTGKISSPEVVSRAGGTVFLRTHLLCGRNISVANFKIHESGMVEMLDDSPVAVDLPVLGENYVDGGAQFFVKTKKTPVSKKVVVTKPKSVKSFAKKIARNFGKEIMEAIGGGQDLVVSVAGLDYDEELDEYEIDINISFNGKMIRADNYQVAGRITVKGDGTGGRFARTLVNENYKEWEGLIGAAKITAAIAEAVNEANKK